MACKWFLIYSNYKNCVGGGGLYLYLESLLNSSLSKYSLPSLVIVLNHSRSFWTVDTVDIIHVIHHNILLLSVWRIQDLSICKYLPDPNTDTDSSFFLRSWAESMYKTVLGGLTKQMKLIQIPY